MGGGHLERITWQLFGALDGDRFLPWWCRALGRGRKNESTTVGLKEGGWQGSKCGPGGPGCILSCWWLQQQLWWLCLWDVDKKVMTGLNGMPSGFLQYSWKP